MATTKIWAIKDSLSRVLQYAANPDKTVLSDLKAVLHYAENSGKTVNEETCFVTGVNCNADTAFEEMLAVQERFGKTGRNVAYHAYQSFKTGEVTPELCHQLGVELARRMWGSDHQVYVGQRSSGVGRYAYEYGYPAQPLCRKRRQYVDRQEIQLQRRSILEIQRTIRRNQRRTQFNGNQKSKGQNAPKHLLCRKERRADHF